MMKPDKLKPGGKIANGIASPEPFAGMTIGALTGVIVVAVEPDKEAVILSPVGGEISPPPLVPLSKTCGYWTTLEWTKEVIFVPVAAG